MAMSSTLTPIGYEVSMGGDIGLPLSEPVVQPATPLSGATVAMMDNSRDRTLYLTPAGTLAVLTVTLPSDDRSRIGQIVRICSTQAITSLTISGATVINNATTLDAGEAVQFQKVAANTWFQIP